MAGFFTVYGQKLDQQKQRPVKTEVLFLLDCWWKLWMFPHIYRENFSPTMIFQSIAQNKQSREETSNPQMIWH